MSAPDIDREMIYHKLTLLARFVDYMGSDNLHHEFESDDYFAMYGLLNGLAKEIYPERMQEIEQRKKAKE